MKKTQNKLEVESKMKINKKIVYFGLQMILGLLCFEVLPPKPNTTIKNKQKKRLKKKTEHVKLTI